MISKEDLISKTGYDSFLKFKRNCQGSAQSQRSIGLTKYYYDRTKTVELDIKPEELFMAADEEIRKNKLSKKRIK